MKNTNHPEPEESLPQRIPHLWPKFITYLAIFIAVVLVIYLGYILSSRQGKFNLPLQMGDVDINNLGRLTPSVENCIEQRLGRVELQNFIQKVKTTRKIDRATYDKISDCFERTAQNVTSTPSSFSPTGNTFIEPEGTIVITSRPKAEFGIGCSRTSVPGLAPLPDVKSYLGYTGGLYPGGSNSRPSSWQQAGIAARDQIKPLDQDGNFSPNGKIVLLSIGFSNAKHEFSGKSKFFTTNGFMQQAQSYPNLNPMLTIVNGALEGHTIDSMIPGGIYYDRYWPQVDHFLSQSGVSAKQVEVIWLKATNACPGQEVCGNKNLTPAPGGFPDVATDLQSDLEVLYQQVLTKRFPNLKQIFVSPRIYGGYALTSLGPEPYAFEYGFAFKWFIEDHIKKGVTMPWVDWATYWWANGTTPNDYGISWTCSDFREDDLTHPSVQGVQKAGKILLDFFSTSEMTCSWFNKDTSSCKR